MEHTKLVETITEKKCGDGLSYRKGFMFFTAKNRRQDLRLAIIHSSQAANALLGSGSPPGIRELSEMKIG